MKMHVKHKIYNESIALVTKNVKTITDVTAFKKTGSKKLVFLLTAQEDTMKVIPTEITVNVDNTFTHKCSEPRFHS